MFADNLRQQCSSQNLVGVHALQGACAECRKVKRVTSTSESWGGRKRGV